MTAHQEAMAALARVTAPRVLRSPPRRRHFLAWLRALIYGTEEK